MKTILRALLATATALAALAAQAADGIAFITNLKGEVIRRRRVRARCS